MQLLSRTTLSIVLSIAATLLCVADEEHLVIDRIDESAYHFAEAGSLPLDVVATNLPVPWSVAWDANDRTVYWTEIGTGSIYRKGLNDGMVESIYESSNSVPRGLVIDGAANILYFLDSDTGTLNALNLNTYSNTLLMSGFIRPNDLAMDRVSKTLYATDSGLDRVVCYNLISNNYHTVLSGSEVDGVWGIDVEPGIDTLYLSDHRTNAIMRANLNGSNLVVLVAGQETPRGLSVDRHHGRLYWLEAENGNLMSSTFYGSDVQVVVSNSFLSPRDLLSYESLDQDGDYLNDDWERLYFGNLLEDGRGDFDGDLLDNFTEQAFGGVPNNSNDKPPGTQISFLEGVGLVLGYYLRTEEWMHYTVWRSTDLHIWEPVQIVDELLFTPDGSNGASRTILIDQEANMLGDHHFFRIDATR